jgi:hypothetical protein
MDANSLSNVAIRVASVPKEFDHYIKKCSSCQTVISQCRCKGPKGTIYGTCPKCAARKGSPFDLMSIAARVAGIAQDQQSQQEQVGYVKKTKGKGYCVKSEKNPDWSGGCYPTKAEADKRLQTVEMFKHMK